MALLTLHTRTLRWSLLFGLLLLPVLAASPAQAQLLDAPWPRFGSDTQNTHQSAYGQARAAFVSDPWAQAGPELTWPALSTADSLYIIAPGAPDLSSTTLYSVSTATGQEGFTTLTLEFRANSLGSSVERVSAPAIDSDGVLYIAVDWEPNDFAGEVIAYDPTGFPGQRVLWEYQIDPSFEEDNHPVTGPEAAAWHTPVLGQDGVLFVHVDHRLFAFEIAPADPSQVDPLWELDGGPFECLNLGPDGTLYARAGGAIQAVNPTDGGIENTFPLDGEAAQNGCPAIALDGTIYATTQTALHAFAPDGQELWTIMPDGVNEPAPTTAPMVGSDGTVYVGGYLNGSEPALTAYQPGDGAVAWTFTPGWIAGAPAPQVSAPTLAPDGSVVFVFGGEDGFEGVESHLWAVDPGTGRALWSRTEAGAAFVSPAVFNSAGALYLIDHGPLFDRRAVQAFDLPALSAEPEEMDHGPVLVNTSSFDTVVLENVLADATVDISNVAVTGEDANAFNASGFFETIQPGGTEQVNVNFFPQEERTYNAMLEITTSSTGTYYVPLSGEGIPAENALLATPSLADFGSVTPGESGTLAVTLSNETTADVPIFATNIEPTEGSPGDVEYFLIEDGNVIEFLLVPAGEEHVITLGFSPTEPGPYEAELFVGYGSEQMLIVPIAGGGTLPQISVTESPASVGEDVTLGVQLEGTGATLLEGVLYFRRGGDPGFQSAPLSGSEGTFTTVIPGTEVTERGVDYFLSFPTPRTNITYPEGAPSVTASIDVVLPPIPAQGMFAADTYRMVSLPLQVENPDATSVLAASYGAPDDFLWRLLRWNDAANEYQDARNDALEMLPGRAFWLITRSGEGFDVEGGTTTSTSEPFALTLEPGWTQVGNPFNFPIDWVMTYPESELELGAIEPPVFFDGESYVFEETVMEPWDGAFVFNNSSEPVTIYIPPISADAPELAGTSLEHYREPEAAYAARISALFPDRQAAGDEGVIGFLSEEEEADQSYQRSKPPAILEGLRLQIMDDEKVLARSFEPLEGEGAVWDVEVVRSHSLGSEAVRARLQLQEEGRRPDGYEVRVIDEDSKRVMQLAGGALSFTFGEQQLVRRFRVVIGTEAFVEAEHAEAQLEAARFDLMAGYPNPFSSRVHIPYSLAEAQDVRIEVYNALGRRIATLVDAHQGAGVHEVAWDGRTATGQAAGSGTYYVRIRAGDFVKTRSIILVR